MSRLAVAALVLAAPVGAAVAADRALPPLEFPAEKKLHRLEREARR
ncbi:hypothetical protein ACU61A_09410 [Pseudonocardia sichuanensis]